MKTKKERRKKWFAKRPEFLRHTFVKIEMNKAISDTIDWLKKEFPNRIKIFGGDDRDLPIRVISISVDNIVVLEITDCGDYLHLKRGLNILKKLS